MNESYRPLRDRAEKALGSFQPTADPVVLRADAEGVDEAYPIRSLREAVEVLAVWDLVNGDPLETPDQYHYYLTHGHAHEWPDIQKWGHALGYIKSRHTKHVSIGWHLAGRYDQDTGLLPGIHPGMKLIDYGAAPWIQSIFFANKDLRVTAVNQSIDSECNRFGRFLAGYNGAPPIANIASDDKAWREDRYDVIYAIDVLEHIVPKPDGSPGWIETAEGLAACLNPGGIWYVNAPIKKQDGPCVPDPDHEFHFTSPITVQEWLAARGDFEQHGPFQVKIK